MRTFSRVVSATIMAAIIGTGLTVPATAAEDQSPSSTASVENLVITNDLNVPGELPDGAIVDEFGTGSVLVAVPNEEPAAGDDGMITPNFSVGVGWTFYVYLDRTDQGAVATGGAAALTVAICALPAVGWGSCAAVTGLLAAAAFYIASNGFCPSRLELAVGRDPKCVN